MTNMKNTKNMIGNAVIVPGTEREIEIVEEAAVEVLNGEMIGETMDATTEETRDEVIGAMRGEMIEEMTEELNAGKNDGMIAGMRGGKIREILAEVEEMRDVTTDVNEGMVDETEIGTEIEQENEIGIVASVARRETTCPLIDMSLGGDDDDNQASNFIERRTATLAVHRNDSIRLKSRALVGCNKS